MTQRSPRSFFSSKVGKASLLVIMFVAGALMFVYKAVAHPAIDMLSVPTSVGTVAVPTRAPSTPERVTANMNDRSQAPQAPALACVAGDLDAYLASKGSPMQGTGSSFVERGRQYNVDPRFMIAIAGAETSFGKRLCSAYNAFNWFYSGWCTSPFSSWDHAIDVVTRGVSQYYLQAGQTTIYSFTYECGNHCYCPNCPNWYNNVRTFYAEQGGNPDTNDLTFNACGDTPPPSTPTPPPSQGVAILEVWPQGDSFSPGHTFHPRVVVQTSGFSLNCGEDFLENRDGNRYGAWPTQGCQDKGGNRYEFAFGDPPMQAPSGAGEYHSKWQIWRYPNHIGPEIDIWFKVSAPPPATPAPSNCSPGSDQVALFVDADFKGQCVVKGIGEYPNPGSIGLPNDSISSIKLGTRVRAMLCRDDNYRGNCEIFTDDDPNLSDNSIGNDSVSSMKVETGCEITSIPGGYRFCAEEGGFCDFVGSANVVYGAEACYTAPRSFTGGIACTNDVFGDPIPGVHKQCYTDGATPTPTPRPSPTPTPTPTPQTISCPSVISGWKGEYWSNENLAGTPTVCRDDGNIDFEWAQGAPHPLLPGDHFSARWTRTIFFSGGTYRFDILHDDGARFYIDGALVLDNWCADCRLRESITKQLATGEHTLRLEMREHSGWAAAQLLWQRTPGAVGTRSYLPAVWMNVSGNVESQVQPFVNGDFESGPGVSWREASLKGWPIILDADNLPTSPHSGRWAAWLGGDNDEIALIQQTVQVPVGLTTLRFALWIASEDLCGYDFGGVVVDEETVVDVFTLCTDTSTDGWVWHDVDLSAYAGREIIVEIRAETDGSLNSNMLVDDVSWVRVGTPTRTGENRLDGPATIPSKNKEGASLIRGRRTDGAGGLKRRLGPQEQGSPKPQR